MERTVERVFKALQGFPFSAHNEKTVQLEMSTCFDGAKSLIYEREVRLGTSGIIDFVVNGAEKRIGIEVKVKGGAEAIYRQCVRYCKSGKIDALVLVTAKSMGFPKEIEGIPCYYFSLSRNLL